MAKPSTLGQRFWDWTAPGLSGMKCLYMSGHTADVLACQSILDERVNFIHKLFRTDELAVAVRNVLERE